MLQCDGSGTQNPGFALEVPWRWVKGSLACTAKIRKIIKYMQKIWQKSPNEFARKAGIELLNEIRLSEGEAQESIMS